MTCAQETRHLLATLHCDECEAQIATSVDKVGAWARERFTISHTASCGGRFTLDVLVTQATS